jgi:hypothetical protein
MKIGSFISGLNRSIFNFDLKNDCEPVNNRSEIRFQPVSTDLRISGRSGGHPASPIRHLAAISKLVHPKKIMFCFVNSCLRLNDFLFCTFYSVEKQVLNNALGFSPLALTSFF